MKKLFCAVVATFALVSCSVDNNETITNSENLTYQVTDENTNVGTYIGVFTTNNSEYRATVEITVPAVVSAAESQSGYATAKLTFNTGAIVYATASKIVKAGEQIENLEFSTQNLSFNFTVNNDGTAPTVSNVVYNTLESSVLIAKDSQRAPVSPILGSFTCTDCGTHPTMNTGVTQTFNVLAVSDNGDGTADISTQVILNDIEFLGDGLQGDCAVNGTLTTCDAFGEISIYGNSTVTWEGSHTYNNEPTGSNDCSDFNGTWSWASTAWGELTGTFQSDDNCNPSVELLNENFNSFTGTGFSPGSTADDLDSNIYICTGASSGAVAYGETKSSGDFGRGTSTGGVQSGGIYAFNTDGAGDMCYGVQPSGNDFTPATMEVRIQNTTGTALSNFTISYDIKVNNNEGRASSFNFSYSNDDSTFTDVAALDYTTPVSSDVLGFVTVSKTTTFAVTVADGDYLYLKFSSDDDGGSGSRDEFGLDNLVVSGN